MGASNITALLEKANTLLQAGDNQESLAAYDSVLALTPNNKEALLGKAEALLSLYRPDEALRYLNHTTRYYPDDEKAWYLLGTTALSMGQGKPALDAFSNYQRLNGASADCFLKLAMASYFNLDLDKAKDFIDLALLEDSQSEEASLWKEELEEIEDQHSLLVEVGRVHCQEGRYEEGLKLLTQSLEIGDSFAAHLYTGRTLSALNKYQQAIPHLEIALERAQDGPEALLDLANAYFYTGQNKEASEFYDRVLSLDPREIEALVGKGRVLMTAGDPEAALNYIEKAIALAPSRPDIWLLKAQVIKSLGQLYEARLCADHAIALGSQEPISWAIGADTLWVNGDKALASKYLEMVKSLAPEEEIPETRASEEKLKEISSEAADLDSFVIKHSEYIHAYHDRAAIYDILDEPGRSLYYLDIVRKRWPEDEDEPLACKRGILLFNLGRVAEATECFRQILEKYPETRVAQEGLRVSEERLEEESKNQHWQLVEKGWEHCREGRYEEGLKLLTQAIDIGDSYLAHLYAGRALSGFSKYQQAVPHFETALQMNPDDPEAMIDLAKAYFSTGRNQETLQFYDKVLRLDPERFDALFGKGQVLIAAGRAETALSYIKQAIVLDPSRPDAWLIKAQALQKIGHLYEARLCADHAIAINQRAKNSWAIGAEILEKNGDKALAQKYQAMVKQGTQGQIQDQNIETNQNMKQVSEEVTELELFLLEHIEYIHAYNDRKIIYKALGDLQRSSFYIETYDNMMSVGKSNAEPKITTTPTTTPPDIETKKAPTPPSLGPEKTLNIMVCQACGGQNNAGARFCSGCGAALTLPPPPPPPQFQPPPPPIQAKAFSCPKCGAQLSSSAKFCVKCGAPIGSTSFPPPTSVAPAEKVCGKCGSRFSSNTKFCTKCGAPTGGGTIPTPPVIPNERVCRKCGAKHSLKTKFCIKCGAPLT